MPNEHAPFSPSSAVRFINCPGSHKASARFENSSSEYADQGTCAHILSEIAYLARLPTHQVLSTAGRIKNVIGAFAELRSYRRFIDDEMYEHTQYYVDILNRIRDAIPLPLRVERIEERVSLEWIHPDLWGTADAILGQFMGDLHVIDFKYGAGIAVDVADNPQLMIYALGALGPHNENNHFNVLTHIVQPRAPHADGSHRVFQMSERQLYDWQDDVLRPAIKTALSDDPPFKAGGWCRFCPAAGACRTLAEHTFETAKAEFNNAPEISPNLPAPSALTPPEIARVLEFKEVITSWVEQVAEYAVGLLQSGQSLPGFKLVARRSNRRWIDPDAVSQLLGPSYGPAIYAPPRLKSPVQMEKMLGPERKKALDGLWEKPDAGVTVAPLSDRRSAVAPSVLAEFTI